ncbi:ferrichrome ABC transporter ATP-binding protein [Neoasaia chiangmaiensis NBRC 101099]|uniref:ABC transporter n=1 Tax=Neoasaia chiangmaiensis TaxID=320497 RepID=A0A1U9KQQ1_9PROT|nr:ABC transporter ATP-binding protein [Neoasaia chiangmaiensis]AQS88067.1 ABC transporter [Neoasaia chiangmaiensis]GBR38752.1 ferrichrome ABC transporter ATP-binding protein [Neoasaia chiangmaiensis NBRC 101099]GEN15745.1 iron(III) ABC transporter ATP-binding protein [Neoasaia chiangmaiensis]
MATIAAGGVVFGRERPVLRGIDFALSGGEMVGLLGVNGAGKSTLLRVLLGLLAPQAGVVRLNGVALSGCRRSAIARSMAYVPQGQDRRLSFTVAEMVMLGRVPQAGLRGAVSMRDRRIVDQALERLGLHALAGRPCNALSGGEWQRVLLARALAQDTPILILDEPLSGLDYGHQLRLLDLLRQLAWEGKAVLLTSHRPEELFARADRVAVLRDGVIAADGAPEVVIEAAAMSALYDVPLRQVDEGRHRFFYRAEAPEG